ncbi:MULTISPECIES: acetoacetate--CoA ligase [unclassified Brevibacterium]|uniref:acetoacetate--CoA ligase n=1 Tax=unclassified Brevibacterium TaxID=2614124 RepID=UPI001E31A830|nr:MULTISPECIES: acetoacetate--CoA ligase [unclassified Brevibacterium]MCD1287674.1 acetoacetate--CoA ligase [Brevibacterium sp. CCUG 69071]MDK8436586.1 acetoacetate--CoA ligase [Brevibacterium sp. H-BE7]
MTAEPIWRPNPDQTPRPLILDFTEFANQRAGQGMVSYDDLWRWSVDDLDGFWSAIWDFFDVIADEPYTEVLADRSMPGATWFPGTHLNYAEHALRHALDDKLADEPAIITITEAGDHSETTWRELRRQVGSVAAWLRSQGVGQGDRVVGYLPNTHHTLIAVLASASIGAIWSACAQDYAAEGAAAKLGQLEPRVLFAADGYLWNGQSFDRRDQVADLAARIPSLRAVVGVGNLGVGVLDEHHTIANLTTWDEVTSGDTPPEFVRVDFDTPLWVLYSSGTTGIPKGIVHSHGGVVVDHLRMFGLHMDIRPGDRFFWYTNTNWMMWNFVVSALVAGGTTVCFDGSPLYPGPGRLWEIAADTQANVLGLSPGILLAGMKAGLEPGREHDLTNLRLIGATGAPVPANCFPWVRDAIGERVQLASTSGGTDVVSGFAGSAPNLEVWAGELSAPNLGVALESWDDSGHPLIDEVGEMVITAPMPTMPVKFWDDPDGQRYRDTYFSMFPGVWRHGDWITITDHGSVIISGRSDATLNRHGVRLGSADIYDVVDGIAEVAESLVIGAEQPDGGYWMPLFVVLADGVSLDDGLRDRIAGDLRTKASPRHVPDDIIAVPAIPHTRTGKKLEVPVKRLIQGHALEKVANPDAVDSFEALRYFVRFAEGAGGAAND